MPLRTIHFTPTPSFRLTSLIDGQLPRALPSTRHFVAFDGHRPLHFLYLQPALRNGNRTCNQFATFSSLL